MHREAASVMATKVTCKCVKSGDVALQNREKLAEWRNDGFRTVRRGRESNACIKLVSNK
jgi:hypothetical protein